jgi:hypothetical protein
LRQWEEFQNGQPPWPNEHQFKECLRRIATSKAVALACSDLLKTASLGDQFVIDLVDRAIFLPSEYYLEPGRILKTDLKKIGKLIGFLSASSRLIDSLYKGRRLGETKTILGRTHLTYPASARFLANTFNERTIIANSVGGKARVVELSTNVVSFSPLLRKIAAALQKSLSELEKEKSQKGKGQVLHGYVIVGLDSFLNSEPFARLAMSAKQKNAVICALADAACGPGFNVHSNTVKDLKYKRRKRASTA